jgi:hypothetical protein
MPDAVTSEPTETPVPTPVDKAVAEGDVASYRAGRRAERTPTTSPVSQTPAASSPAPPEEPAAETSAQASPASEPGTEPKPKGAKARSAELDKDIAELNERLRLRKQLREELDALGHQPKQDVKPGSSPAAKIDAPEDPEPTLESFQNDDDPYLAFTKASAAWTARQEHRKLTADLQARNQKEAYERELNSATQRMEAKAREKYADWDAVRDAAVEEIKAETRKSWSADISEFVAYHPQGHELAYALLKDGADSARLSSITHPVILGFEIGSRLAKLSQPQTPAPKTVSGAPPPPQTLGSRAAQPANPIDSAVAEGDVSSYRRARLAERTANLR